MIKDHNTTLHPESPNLPSDSVTEAIVGSKGLLVNLYDPSMEFPQASFFRLEKFGKSPVQTSALTVMGHSSLVFHDISKEHHGTYRFSVENYHLRNRTQPIGFGATNMTLDVLCECIPIALYDYYHLFCPSTLVLDDPEMSHGPCKHDMLLGDPLSCGYILASKPSVTITWSNHYVLLGDPVSLICGYNLDSNPPVTITWTNPQGKLVKSSDNYHQDDGPATVQLNISKTTANDNGLWQCYVKVRASGAHVNSYGVSEFGHLSHKIHLNIIGKRVVTIFYSVLTYSYISTQKPICLSMCLLLRMEALGYY